MNDRKKIRDTENLMIGFAREGIKCKINEGSRKRIWSDLPIYCSLCIIFTFFFCFEITPVTTTA